MYALLPNKNKRTYIRLFRIVQQLVLWADNSITTFNPPESFTTDFEAGAVAAIQSVFPTTRNRGCLFHFGQCIYRQIQTCGLKGEYEKNLELTKKLRVLLAFAYVPVNEVRDLFKSLEESKYFPTGEDVQKVI